MDEEPDAGRAAVMVWLKLLGMLALLAIFGVVVFWLRRASIAR
jgi:hypothetical protein